MLYFAYGMNTNRQGMTLRCPQARALGAATLPGWRFRFAGPADIVRDPHSEVQGVLWDISHHCLNSLDDLEGYPHFYDRDWVTVVYHGSSAPAMTYFMQPGIPARAPSPGYLDCVVEGYRNFGVDPQQIHKSLALFEQSSVVKTPQLAI